MVIPEGIDRSLWLGWDGQVGVVDRCSDFGVEFDTWQDGLGQVALGVRSDGIFAATVGGVILSIPRQVAKTFITMCMVVALCTMFPNLTVLWTAHRTRTATQTFQKMQGFVRRKAVKKYLAPTRNDGVRSGSGEQEIAFRNGSVIMFGAREQGFGRGFDEVDIEVFDEAQILTEKALEDMVAATNQSRWIFGALLFFMGTPPRPVDPGEEFINRRRKALAVKGGAGPFAGVVEGGNAVFVECSADPDCGKPGGPKLDDRKQIELANPSYPHRTPETSIQRLRENLTNDDSWRREGLGIHDELEQLASAIDPFAWRDLTVPAPPTTDGTRSYAVVFHRDGTSVSLSAALKHPYGVHVETIARRPLTEGTWWIVQFFTAERDGRARHETAAQIVVFGKAGSTGLASDLRKAGVAAKCLIIGTQDNAITAATMLREAVNRGEVTHLADPDVLDASIAGSREHKVGQSGGWVLVPKTDDDDSTPAESAGMALWAAKTTKRRPGRKTRGTVMA